MSEHIFVTSFNEHNNKNMTVYTKDKEIKKRLACTPEWLRYDDTFEAVDTHVSKLLDVISEGFELNEKKNVYVNNKVYRCYEKRKI